MQSTQKHFLDSSVARAVLLGTQEHKRYFKEQFAKGVCYVSPYVQMEIRRSYLGNIISFYFTLNLPTIPSYGDALKLWANKFKGSEIKAVLQLAGELANAHRIDQSRPRDKPAALLALGLYIKRLDQKLRGQFRNVGRDSARCARAVVELHLSQATMAEGLRLFLDAFEDVEGCRSKCRIDKFLLERHRQAIEAYVEQAEHLPRNNETRGFLGIVKSLNEVLSAGPDACSCKRCESVGDAVIALDAPSDMQLEHTDNSFDYLCPPLGQPHRKHPSEIAVVTQAASTAGGATPRTGSASGPS
jgi:hypothetical protein